MNDFNFKKYSLMLVKEEKIIFSSKNSGLSPLIECIKKYQGKVFNAAIYDKVIGLASAKLIVYSGIASQAFTLVASKSAKNFLAENRIELKADFLADQILKKDLSGPCPMEIKAGRLSLEEFINETLNN